MSCPICEAIESPDKLIFETPYWAVNLSPDQGYLGRSYVTLKRHTGALSELSTEEWQDFSEVVTKIESVWGKLFGAAPFNWACMMNNAYQASPAEPHVHWHVRPRYQTPPAIGTQEFPDLLYGHHYDRDFRNLVDNSTFAAILDKLRAELGQS